MPVSPPPPPPPPGAPPATPATEIAWTYADWEEVLAQQFPAGAELFSETNESCALAILIRNSQRREFLYKVPGYCYADPGSPYRLRRVNPLPHPFWGFTFATQVGFTPFNPAGNPADIAGKPKVTYGFTSAAFPVDRSGYYTHCHAVVNFGSVPYPLREDSDFGTTGYLTEADRNVDYYADTAGEVSIISAETGSAITFIEGGPVGKPFKGEIGEYVTKINLTWVWYGVPSTYLFNASGLPIRLLRCLGKVNLTPFRGNPAGTLLLSSFNLKRYAIPWRQSVGASSDPVFAYHVTLVVSQFDPDTAVEPPAFRGHNLMPWAATRAANGSIWYAATRDGTTGGPRYLQSAEYSDLFKHALAP